MTTEQIHDIFSVTKEMTDRAEELVKEIAPQIALRKDNHLVIGLAIAKLLGVWLASHGANSKEATALYRSQLSVWINLVSRGVVDYIDKAEEAKDKERNQTNQDLS